MNFEIFLIVSILNLFKEQITDTIQLYLIHVKQMFNFKYYDYEQYE